MATPVPYSGVPLASLGFLAGGGLGSQQLYQQNQDNIMRTLGLGAQMFSQQQSIKAQREAQERSIAAQRESQERSLAEARQREARTHEFSLTQDRQNFADRLSLETERANNEYFQRYGHMPARPSYRAQQRIQLLERELGNIDQLASVGDITPQMRQQRQNRINEELRPLREQAQIGEQQQILDNFFSESRTVQGQFLSRSFPVRNPWTNRDELVYMKPDGTPMVLFDQPRSESGQAAPSPTQMLSFERAAERRHMVADPETGRQVPDPNVPREQIQREAREEMRRFQLGGNWGNSPVANTIGSLASNVPGPSRDPMRTRVVEDLGRMEEIANLTNGFTDAAWMGRYRQEVGQIMRRLDNANPQAFAAIQQALSGIEGPPGTQAPQRGRGMISDLIERAGRAAQGGQLPRQDSDAQALFEQINSIVRGRGGMGGLSESQRARLREMYTRLANIAPELAMQIAERWGIGEPTNGNADHLPATLP